MNPDPNRTILIAEDEPFLLKILAETFEMAGFQVFRAADGEQALNLALANRPRVTVLDIMMPKMDGITVLQRIRQQSWGRNALIIMLTNLTADNQILQGMSANLPSYYFVKANMEPDQLLVKVEEILGQSPAPVASQPTAPSSPIAPSPAPSQSLGEQNVMSPQSTSPQLPMSSVPNRAVSTPPQPMSPTPSPLPPTQSQPPNQPPAQPAT